MRPIVRFEGLAGEFSQHDFGQVVVTYVDGWRERLHFFAAPYRRGDVLPGARTGLADEGEDIEVLELSFDDALGRIGRDIVDAKTIMLLQWAALRGPFAS